MKNKFSALAAGLIFLLVSGQTVLAQDFGKGLAAYKAGDYESALEAWRPLAKLGDARAQNYLGIMYNRGYGVVQDYGQAAKWYRIAAEQGSASAQANLGVLYAEGGGVIQDNIRAYMWLNMSSAQGLALAKVTRDVIAKQMTPADISKAQTLARDCVQKTYKGC